MTADRIDYYANQLRGIPVSDLGRKIREILREVAAEVAAEREAKPVANTAFIDWMAEQMPADSVVEVESAGIKKDAARYRWMMKDDGHNALMSTLASLCAKDDPIKPQMDAAIDAAIAAKKE
jgi:hypothetical protein